MTREEAIQVLQEKIDDRPLFKDEREAFELAIEALSEVRRNDCKWKDDVIEVVRCKDCRHKVLTKDGEYNEEDIVCDYWLSDGLDSNDFCSMGERQEL